MNYQDNKTNIEIGRLISGLTGRMPESKLEQLRTYLKAQPDPEGVECLFTLSNRVFYLIKKVKSGTGGKLESMEIKAACFFMECWIDGVVG